MPHFLKIISNYLTFCCSYAHFFYLQAAWNSVGATCGPWAVVCPPLSYCECLWVADLNLNFFCAKKIFRYLVFWKTKKQFLTLTGGSWMNLTLSLRTTMQLNGRLSFAFNPLNLVGLFVKTDNPGSLRPNVHSYCGKPGLRYHGFKGLTYCFMMALLLCLLIFLLILSGVLPLHGSYLVNSVLVICILFSGFFLPEF